MLLENRTRTAVDDASTAGGAAALRCCQTRNGEEAQMALINWNDSLSVDVAEIDQQHKKLIALINELNDAMSVGKGKDVLQKIANDLVAYTATHFRTEERYFAQFEYPDTFNHRREHVEFVKKVAGYKEGIERGTPVLTTEVMKFLSDWLKKHIMVTDKKYSRFFNEKGLR
jgi:hemerythrin